MATYKCARELEGICLQEKDLIEFSDVGVFNVRHSSSMGWYLNGREETNDAVFKYLYGTKDPYNCIEELGDYITTRGGVFPYLETAEALTEVVGKLFLEVERKRLREFDFKKYVPKGSVAVLSKDNIFKLCRNQVEQGNVFDIGIFEKYWLTNRKSGGMAWAISMEGESYWKALFYLPYPHIVSSTVIDTSLKQPETESFGGEKINPDTPSLATLSIKRAQKPKLRTL